MRSNVTLSDGQRNLRAIIKELDDTPVNWNEANTRFHLIDRLLIECFGWSREPSHFIVEAHLDGEYLDYILGSPSVLVVEAKRSGTHFDFPADADNRLIVSIEDIFAISSSAEKAIRQVQGYCSDSGVEFAVICNGHQIIAFCAVRIGQSWLKGRALVARTLNHMLIEFPQLWQCLSPDGIYEKRLFDIFGYRANRSVPQKLSTQLLHYPSFRYKSDLQTNLRTLAELLLEDLISSEAMRPQFYRECYCDTGELSRDAMVSKNILEARYAALFAKAEESPYLEPAAKAGDIPSLSNQIVSESLARRPIVLLGDAGVGKTSFLENLMEVRAEEEFRRSVYIYIDLGSRAALATDIRQFVIDEIERQLHNRYNVDIYEHNFVRGVYDLEVKRFRSSFKAAIYKSNKTKHDEQLMARLEELVDDKPEHLRRSIQHVARGRKQQVIVILDNADQRPNEIQQAAFIIAQEMAKTWDAVVFISVRPQTFFQSKRAGALSAYPHKIFTIFPPRPEIVIEKRLVFALKIAEGKIAPDLLLGVRMQLTNIAAFIRVMLTSISSNDEIREFLANITSGNIRAVVELITGFIGSPNIEAEKIVGFGNSGASYVIPIHEFSKAAILGDYSYYDSNTSLAMNIFDVESADRTEHFLCVLILGYVLAVKTEKDRDGFIETNSIIQEMQRWGFIPVQAQNALRRLTNKRLIETLERVTFEEDLIGLIRELPGGFRPTSIGAYHLRRWAGSFGYLDAMLVDTPIFDQTTRDEVAIKLGSFDIADRYDRTVRFREYLSSTWQTSNFSPDYVDWNECVRNGQADFDRVSSAIRKISGERTRKRDVWEKR